MADGDKELILSAAKKRMPADQVDEWFRSAALPGFGDWTAADLVEAGRGAEVLELFKAIDAGVFT